jgi:vacuolar-type H+-ATPase subunit B/Vma2
MKRVGFMGGSSLVELGDTSEMIDFLRFFSEKMERYGDSELSNRLYKKYIKLEQLGVLALMVKELKVKLSSDEDKYLNIYQG